MHTLDTVFTLRIQSLLKATEKQFGPEFASKENSEKSEVIEAGNT